jgi:DNA invertase Pin-like site-specific DNA recombinase
MPNSVDDLSYSRNALKSTLRALIYIRQSKKKDASESPATQLADNTAHCERMGWSVATVVEEIGVSAQKSPFARKKLSPWLTDPEKLVQWDVLVVWKMDRLVRDDIHFYGEVVPQLVQKYGKRVAAVIDRVDTDREDDEFPLMMHVQYAKKELRTRRERATGSRKGLRLVGKWAGGVPSFGWKPAKRPQGGWGLVIDEEAQDVLYQIYSRLKKNEKEAGVDAKANVNQIITWLNAEEIPTPYDWNRRRRGEPMKGHLWCWTNMAKMLTRYSLLGIETHKGDIVRDEKGDPIRFSPVGLLTREQWDEIGRILAGNRVGSYSSRHEALLSGFFLCGCCGGKYYHNAATIKENANDAARQPTVNRARYQCSVRKTPGVGKDLCQSGTWRADEIEPAVVEMFLAKYGDAEVQEVKVGNSTDYSGEIAELEESLTALDIDFYEKGKFRGDAGGRRYEQIKARLDKRLEELTALQSTYGKVERTGTGHTYRDEWLECRTVEERNRMLRRVGLVVTAKRPVRGGPSFAPEITVELPDLVHVLAA